MVPPTFRRIFFAYLVSFAVASQEAILLNVKGDSKAGGGTFRSVKTYSETADFEEGVVIGDFGVHLHLGRKLID